jgi:ribonucleoside-triphosphate reductase
MIGAEKLHRLFDEDPDKSVIGFEGKCHDCGCDVKVDVSLVPEGFMISGGAVYEPQPEQYFTKCDACYEKNPKLTKFQKCEVYSRVVGYLRPVSQWNEGKQEEFVNRKTFNIAQ